MAQHRRSDEPVDLGAVLRAELIEIFRVKCARYRPVNDAGDGRVYVSPWPRILARLEAGEPVEVHRYQLPSWHPLRSGTGRVRIESDGTVVVL